MPFHCELPHGLWSEFEAGVVSLCDQINGGMMRFESPRCSTAELRFDRVQ